MFLMFFDMAWIRVFKNDGFDVAAPPALVAGA